MGKISDDVVDSIMDLWGDPLYEGDDYWSPPYDPPVGIRAPRGVASADEFPLVTK